MLMSWSWIDRSGEFDRRMKWIEHVLGLLRHAPNDPRYRDVGKIEADIAHVWVCKRQGDVTALVDALADLEARLRAADGKVIGPAYETGKKIRDGYAARRDAHNERQRKRAAADRALWNKTAVDKGYWDRDPRPTFPSKNNVAQWVCMELGIPKTKLGTVARHLIRPPKKARRAS